MISAALALTLLGSPAQATTDLPKSHGFYEVMTYLIDKGALSGYGDGTIKPDKIVTRAEAAIMIGKLKNFDGTQTTSTFKDVSKSQKASGYIAAVHNANYIKGFPDGTFRPDAPITRGDMAMILDRIYNIANVSGVAFKDVSENMRAYDAIGNLVVANVTAGYTDGTFRPKQAITRGQLSAFIARVLEPKFKNDTHMENSYLRDKTKSYTYQTAKGTFTESYKYVNANSGLEYGYMWTSTNTFGARNSLYIEFETKDELRAIYPYSESDLDLVYPVKVGKTFENGLGEIYISTITGVNQTVKTPFKTFTNAVEVTTEDGYKYYLVEGYGSVKHVDNKGNVTSQLLSIK